MTSLKLLLLPFALLAVSFGAHAEDGDTGRTVFWEGNCRVEQKFNRYGELLERRRCRADSDAGDDELRRAASYRDAPRYRRPLAVRTRVVARAEPVPKVVRKVPAAHAPRIVAKVHVPVKVARHAAPHLLAKAVPVAAAPPEVAKAEPVVKTAGNYPKSDWLVILAPGHPKAETAKAAPAAKSADDVKAERLARLHEYEDYVAKKSKERYSNLK